MGSIVSHIHDLLEEFGTWKNYQLMESKKQQLDKFANQIGQITQKEREAKSAFETGLHGSVYHTLLGVYNQMATDIARRMVEIQKEIDSGCPSRPCRRRPGYQEHELKTLPTYYQQAISGQKRFEYRRNDRCYQVGDVLILREYILPDLTDPGGYTGARCEFIINHVLDCSAIDPGSQYVVLQITPYS